MRELAERMEGKRNLGERSLMGFEFEAYLLPATQREFLLVAAPMPDVQPLDPGIELIQREATFREIRISAPFLVGAMRPHDAVGAGRLRFRDEQLLPNATAGPEAG